MKVKVAQSCPTLCDPMYYTVHGILQARTLEWVAFPFSRGSSQLRNQTGVSCIAGGFFTNWAMREAMFAFFFFNIYFFISWRLITLQYCSGFCHTLTWISHGYTCIPHLNPPSHLPLQPIPLGLPSAPGPSTWAMFAFYVDEPASVFK